MQDRLYNAFNQEVTLARSCTWRRSNQFFIVYVNNLTEQRLSNIRDALRSICGIRWLDELLCTFFLKTYFSFILCNAFLKAERIIIQGHGR